jgi:two-component system OmpR family response regulator
MKFMQLLLAEDDLILANGLTAQLSRAGFVVQHAPNGPVAEYLLTNQNYDIAILDLGLPMIDGLSVRPTADPWSCYCRWRRNPSLR